MNVMPSFHVEQKFIEQSTLNLESSGCAKMKERECQEALNTWKLISKHKRRSWEKRKRKKCVQRAGVYGCEEFRKVFMKTGTEQSSAALTLVGD